MPSISNDSEYKTSGSNLFVSLKSKGDKLHYRIIGEMYYDGKHFSKVDDKWNIAPCPRINEGNPCDTCEKYFDIIKQIKKDSSDAEKANIKKQADPYKAAITFYIPVIDRDSEEFKIFQTKLSVRKYFESEVAIGTKIMERDFVTIRTEMPGNSYYKTTALDSSDTAPLSEKERKAIEEGKKINLEEKIGGQKDTVMSEPAEQEVDVEDIPF